MPRYKFSWELLPKPLLRSLKTALELTGDPAAALRKEFGARPGDEFVKIGWPLLLETWLRSDRQSRIEITEHLRSKRLGDMSIGVRSAAAQMDYLRSCRNSATLRGVVLELLLAAGEAPTSTKSPVAAGSPKRSNSWQQFVTALAASLSALDEDQYLVIARKDRAGFVQFAAQGSYGLRAELASNAYLDVGDQLAPEAIASAIALGWNEPTGSPDEATADRDPDGSPNYFREWAQPVAFIDASRLAVDTLVDVLGVSHPGTLQYSAFANDGSKILLPTLGLRAEPKQPVSTGPAAPPSDVTLDADAIRTELLALIRRVSGDDALDVDSDGDIPLRYDSAMVFVRVLGDPPIVRIFSPVLAEARMGRELVEEMNRMNSEYLFMRWTVAEGAVVASIDQFADPFVGQHVLHACGVLGETVNDLDEQLQERFGGRTFFSEYESPKPPVGQFGYL